MGENNLADAERPVRIAEADSPAMKSAMEAMEHKIAHRRSRGHVVNKGYVVANTDVALSLQGPMMDLEKKLLKSQLARGLPSRQTKEELQKSHILPHGNAAPRIEAARHDLEKEMLRDGVGRKLSEINRQEHEGLKNLGIVYDGGIAASSLHPKMHQLEKSIKCAKLNKNLASRPNMTELPGTILHSGPGGALQAEFESLERNMKADALNKALLDRPPPPKSVQASEGGGTATQAV